MTANNKEDFLFQLHHELHRIGIDANEDIFADFEEHFKASANEGLSEEETCRRLGDVKEIARGYLNMESERINSLVAQAVESEKPKVSLTKAGHSEPADLSLRKSEPVTQSAQTNSAPIREYTPEHISAEIYPDSQKANNSAQSETAPKGEQNAAQNSAQTAQNEQSVAQAFSAAGKAAAAAFVTAGHAVADAVNTDAVKGAVKGAGKAAADAMASAGQAVANAVHTTAENIKNEHSERASHEHTHSVPHPQNTARANVSDSREGYVPEQDESQQIKSKNSYSYESIKGKKPNVNAGKLVTAIILDVFLWSWLIPMLAGIAIALAFAAFPQILAAGFGVIFGAAHYYLITRLFLGIGEILTGIIVLCLDILLIKGIVNIVKSVVIRHIKAIYDI